MNWINIECTTLDSEEFLGAEPIERATWLCLLRYCVGQENGGRITGAREWKDRKWQQVVRVTAREIFSECDLWVWDGNDLIISFYPKDKEEEVRRNRENGAKGGRPRKAIAEPKPKPNGNHPVSDSETARFYSAETERKGIGKEGNKGERDYARDAEKIVAHYPRQEKRNDAILIVVSHLREGDDPDLMLAGTKACAAVIRTLPSGAKNRYVPSAESFFRSKRWADDPETLRRHDRDGDTSKPTGHSNSYNETSTLD